MQGRGRVIREVTQASRRKWAYLREAYGRGGGKKYGKKYGRSGN